MPMFTVEKSYLAPIYVHEQIEAETAEEAARLSVDSNEWEGSEVDYETSGPTFVTAIWEGDEAYPGGDITGLPIPAALTRDAVLNEEPNA